MPTYEFENTTTGEIEEHVMKMSEKDTFVAANPHLKSIIGTPGLVRGIATKPDAGFRDVLHKIKAKANKGITRSTINTF